LVFLMGNEVHGDWLVLYDIKFVCQVLTNTVIIIVDWPLQYTMIMFHLNHKFWFIDINKINKTIITMRAMRMCIQIVHVNSNSFNVLLHHLCVNNSWQSEWQLLMSLFKVGQTVLISKWVLDVRTQR